MAGPSSPMAGVLPSMYCKVFKAEVNMSLASCCAPSRLHCMVAHHSRVCTKFIFLSLDLADYVRSIVTGSKMASLRVRCHTQGLSMSPSRPIGFRAARQPQRLAGEKRPLKLVSA
jgi:hypothetical protein